MKLVYLAIPALALGALFALGGGARAAHGTRPLRPGELAPTQHIGVRTGRSYDLLAQLQEGDLGLWYVVAYAPAGPDGSARELVRYWQRADGQRQFDAWGSQHYPHERGSILADFDLAAPVE